MGTAKVREEEGGGEEEENEMGREAWEQQR